MKMPRAPGGPAGQGDGLFRLTGAVRRHPDVEAWFAADDPVRLMTHEWFEDMRDCGPDVCELLHDGHPTACVGGAAFAYVQAFTSHAHVGFFHGAALADPAGLLQGTGTRMRHVKLDWGPPPDGAALTRLITLAYQDIRQRLRGG